MSSNGPLTFYCSLLDNLKKQNKEQNLLNLQGITALNGCDFSFLIIIISAGFVRLTILLLSVCGGEEVSGRMLEVWL